MDKTINLDEFLSRKKNLHYENTTNYTDAFRFFVENEKKSDITSFDLVRTFSLMNTAVLEKDEDNNYYYQYFVYRYGDIVDNIRFESTSNLNVKLSYYIENKKYMPEELDKFVFVAAPYSDFFVRVTFMEKPTNNYEFNVISRHYLINLSDRTTLMRANKVITKDGNVYTNGIFNQNKNP